MVKRGTGRSVQRKRSSPPLKAEGAGMISGILVAFSLYAAVLGSGFIKLFDQAYRGVFIRRHRLEDKGFTIVYDQNVLTKDVVEVGFFFDRPRPERQAHLFLHGVVSRACSTMPVDLVYTPESRSGWSLAAINAERLTLPSPSQFSKRLSGSRCPDPTCPDRSFEVWENDDERTYIKFHFSRGSVREIAVTGNHALLRRVYHHA